MIELVIRFGVFRVLLSVVDFRTRKGRASSPGRPPHHVQANNCAVIAVARALVNSRWMSSSTFERASKPTGADFYALSPWSIPILFVVQDVKKVTVRPDTRT